jgi:hypothetical protein
LRFSAAFRLLPLLFALFFFTGLTPVQATAYSVDCTTSDLIAKFNSAAGSSSQADTITLSEGCVYTLTSVSGTGSDNGANGLRLLTSSSGTLTVNGNGATIQRSSAAGTALFRLFEVSTGTLIMNDLTLANGSTSDAAGLWNYEGTVTLRNVTISGSSATSDGGGIANSGTMTLINSTVSGNTAGNNAAGIYNDGTLTLINSTVSGNSATMDGGGIYNIGALSLVQTTLAGNSSGRNGGGLYLGGATTLHNSIVADSASGGDCYRNGSPTITRLGANLVEDGGCGLTGSNLLNSNPRLSALASNDGATKTHALASNSPAVDAGSSPRNDLTTDQRGQPRVYGAAVDLGAYELQTPIEAPPLTVTVAQALGQADPTKSGPVVFTVVFSAAVTGFTGDLVDLSASTALGTLVALVSEAAPNNGTTYTVSISGMSADGVVRLSIPAGSLNENEASTSDDNSVTYDTTAPDTTLDSSPPDATNDATPTFSFSSAEAGATFECRFGTNEFVSCASPFTADVLEDETYTFAVRALDAAGNADATPATATFTVDTTAPTVTVSSSASSPTNGALIPLTISFSEAVSGFATTDLLIGNGAPGTLSTEDNRVYTLSVTPTFDGEVSVSIAANVVADAAGNGNSALETSFRITYDGTAPTTTISAPLNDALLNTASPTFSFSTNEDEVTYSCALDLSSFACESPYFYDGTLGEGPHSFTVAATDAAGNVETSPAAINFSVDTVAPDTTLDSAPDALIASDSATFEFSSLDGSATFECALDDDDYTTCVSPVTLDELSEGPHTFVVRATDTAGNVDASPATASFTVDTTAPQVTISAPSAGALTNDATPSVVFSAGDAVTTECQVDDGALVACSSPFMSSALDDGEHIIRVQATDAAGNTGSASVTFTVDTTPPVTTISAPLNDSLTRDASQSVSFSSEVGATFECRLGSADFSACTSPFVPASPLSDGPHTVQVRATDAAGNVESTPASVTFTVNTSAPDTTLDSAPDALIASASATFEFSSASDGVSFECALDEGDYDVCVSPLILNNLDEGPHTFAVRAKDVLGNVDESPANHTFTVDTVAPVASISAPQDGSLTNTVAPAFSFSAEDGATLECRLDNEEFEACASPWTPAQPLSDALHTFAVRATDAAGNIQTSPTMISFTVDTHAPDTSLASGPSGAINYSVVTVSFTSEDGASFECRLNTDDFAVCASPFVSDVLAADDYTFEVRAKDAAGNVDATPAQTSFSVDTSAPDTTLDTAPDALTNDAMPQFSFSSLESNVTFECAVDDDVFEACTSPFTASTLGDGAHRFRVRAKDAAGNADPTPAEAQFSVDTTAPTIESITRVGSSPTNAASIGFSVTFSEPVVDVDADDFALTSGLTGAQVIGVSGSEALYTVTVSTGSGDGSLRLDLASSATVTDAAGNSLVGGTTAGESYSVVRSGPLVSSISFDADNSAYAVTFSAEVTGVDASDFSLASEGITAALGEVTGSGNTYSVGVTWSGVGTLALTVLDDDSIIDELGNPLGGVGAGNGALTSAAFDNRPDTEPEEPGEDDATPSPTPNVSAAPVPTAAPTPPPAPLLSDLDGSTNTGVRARVPEGSYGVYGRVLAMDGGFEVDAAQIGIPDVLARGVQAAVDVFSPNGGSAAGTQVCLRGAGIVLFMDAATSPRQVSQLASTSEAEMTCATLPGTGTVVLVAS